MTSTRELKEKPLRPSSDKARERARRDERNKSRSPVPGASSYESRSKKRHRESSRSQTIRSTDSLHQDSRQESDSLQDSRRRESSSLEGQEEDEMKIDCLHLEGQDEEEMKIDYLHLEGQEEEMKRGGRDEKKGHRNLGSVTPGAVAERGSSDRRSGDWKGRRFSSNREKRDRELDRSPRREERRRSSRRQSSERELDRSEREARKNRRYASDRDGLDRSPRREESNRRNRNYTNNTRELSMADNNQPRRSRTRSNRSSGNNVVANTNVEDDVNVHAIMLEEEEGGGGNKIMPTQEEQQALISKMVAKEAARLRAEERKQEEEERQERRRKKRKRNMVLLIALLTLIVVGVSVFFALRNNNKENATTDEELVVPTTGTSLPNATTTLAPADAGTETVVPSSFPTIELLYEPPSKEDCNAMSLNKTIAGREEKENVYFGIELEVVLSEDNKIMTEQLVQELMEGIQEVICPSLAGCSIFLYEVTEAWRFVIFDAFVWGNAKPEEECADEKLVSQNCHRVWVRLDLYLKGAVKFLSILRLISNEEENFSSHLGLSDSFVFSATSLTPTAEPTTVPSNVPSLVPTEFPTTKPPALSPVTSKPTSTPVKSPTKAPVKIPTPSPTLVPSANPTSAPVVGPSPPPTKAPPTLVPSANPTGAPVVGPSPPPTKAPTQTPSAQPSKRPSSQPSENPSSSPSESPSSAPSKTPSQSPSSAPTTPQPSWKPSFAPSAVPSKKPSMAPSLSFAPSACAAGAEGGVPIRGDWEHYNYPGEVGRYFLWLPCHWEAVFGSIPAVDVGTTYNVKQMRNGQEVWQGTIVIWFTDGTRPEHGLPGEWEHGRRDPKSGTAADQWINGDLIVPN